MAAYKDYYKILGVDRKATQAEIKTAFRKAARKHHPDLQAKNEKAASEEKFKEINEAYAVLSDPEKRTQYDHLGDNLQSGQEWQPTPATGGFGSNSWDIDDADGFSEFFASLFGQTRPGSRSEFRQTRSARGPNLESELELTLEEAFHGGQKSIQFSVSGGAGGKAAARKVDVRIPPFIRGGTVIRLKGLGGEGTGTGAAGDLLLTIKILPHTCFTLNGTCLETSIKIRPEQAVLGAQITAPTMEGEVMITIPPMTHNGQKLRLRAKGWQDKTGNRGDEYVQVKIDIPRSISQQEKDIYQRLADLKSTGRIDE